MLLGALMNVSAQRTLPVEEYYKYVTNPNKRLASDNITKVKDVNDVFRKFYGFWKGTYKGKTYRLVMDNDTKKSDSGVERDYVVMRYRVQDANGRMIENSISTPEYPDDQKYEVRSEYLDKRGNLQMFFSGGKSECGIDGILIVYVEGGKMSVTLVPQYQYPCDNPTIVFPPKESIIFSRGF